MHGTLILPRRFGCLLYRFSFRQLHLCLATGRYYWAQCYATEITISPMYITLLQRLALHGYRVKATPGLACVAGASTYLSTLQTLAAIIAWLTMSSIAATTRGPSMMVITFSTTSIPNCTGLCCLHAFKRHWSSMQTSKVRRCNALQGPASFVFWCWPR